MEPSDRQLLRRYLDGRDERAFQGLVERHLPLVYGVALRVTKNAGHAQDISQATMIRLAERAHAAVWSDSLPAWLHRIARHLAIDFVRREDRRRRRESESLSRQIMERDSFSPDWSALSPVVDAMVDRLPEIDRKVLLMRYFSQLSHSAIGSELGLTEEGVRKRGARALEKLRKMLAKQGVATTPSSLAAILPVHASAPLPASLVASVQKAAIGVAPKSLANTVAFAASEHWVATLSAAIFLTSLSYSVLPVSLDPPSPSTAASQQVVAIPEKPLPRVRKVRPALPASQEGRFERLKEILAIPATRERTAEMLGFLDELPPGLLGEAAGQMKTLTEKNSDSSTEFLLLASMWAKADPEAAASYAIANLSPSLVSPILKVWGAMDPAAAIAWAKANPSRGAVNGRLMAVLAGVARRDVQPAIDAIRSQPDAKTRKSAFQSIYLYMADQPDAWEKLIPLADEPELRASLITLSSDVVPPEKIGSMLALLEEKYGPDKSGGYGVLFSNWVSEDRDGALKRLEGLSLSEAFPSALAGACTALSNIDPSAAFHLIDSHPGILPDEDLGRVITNVAFFDPASATEAASRVRDGSIRDRLLAENLERWLNVDSPGARDWIRTATLSAKVLQQLNLSDDE